MKQELTRKQGIILFILFTAGLVAITLLSIFADSSSSTDQGDNPSGGSSISSSLPKPAPTPTGTPTPIQQDRSEPASVRSDLVLTAAGYITGVDPAVPPAKKLETLGGKLSKDAQGQLTKALSGYDWNKIAAQGYLRMPNVDRLDVVSDKNGVFVIRAYISLSESKKGSEPTALPSEVWQFTLKDVNGAWQITDMTQVS